MQIIQESGAHAEYWIASIVKVILNLRISLGGNNNFGYLRWSNWIFWFPLSPNWMCKWSVCTMNLCPWLFSPVSAWEMCACAWICTKPHGVSFPAVSSQEPPEHTHNTNGLLIGLVLATFSCPFLVLLFDPRQKQRTEIRWCLLNRWCPRSISFALVWVLWSAEAALLCAAVIFACVCF